MTSASPGEPLSPSPVETWSTFTQVVTRLQACQAAAAPSTLNTSPSGLAQKRRLVETGEDSLHEAVVCTTAAVALPPQWSPEWVLLVYLKAILLCPLCGTLLSSDATVIETCGHVFCSRCILTAIEDGNVSQHDTWPYNVVLFDDVCDSSATPSSHTAATATSETSSEAATSPHATAAGAAGAGIDLTELGARIARRQRINTRAKARQASQHPSRPRRQRAEQFVCPLCRGPAFKWTTMRLPLLEQVCTHLASSVPHLQAKLQALQEPTQPPPPLSSLCGNSRAHAEPVEIISISSDSASSLSVAHRVSMDDQLAKLISVTSIKTEPEYDEEPHVAEADADEEEETTNDGVKNSSGGHGDDDEETVDGPTSPPQATPVFSVPLFAAPEPVSLSNTATAAEAEAIALTPPPLFAVVPSASTSVAHDTRDPITAAPSSLALLGGGLDDDAEAEDYAVPTPPGVNRSDGAAPQHGAYRNLLYCDTP